MKSKEEYATGVPHYQDRKQYAAADFIAGWDAAERWRTDKEDIPEREAVLALYHDKPFDKFYADEVLQQKIDFEQ